MADYPTSKKDKALARRGFSSSSKPYWRELMERFDTVPSGKALQAPDVVSGFAGSWAAQYTVDNSVRSSVTEGEGVPPVQERINRLGQPGMAEINFRPYDVNTGREGKYGPSLLGHPISFSIVGPTLKNYQCIHQWRLDTTGPQDRLYIDSCSSVSTIALPSPQPGNLATINDIYGIGAASFPEEGLYIVISATGAESSLFTSAGPVVDGGLGDGGYGDGPALPSPRQPISPKLSGFTASPNRNAKFEIFRVTGIDTTVNPDDTLILDEGKRLSEYFDIPDESMFSPVIRAIMMFRPAAARVVAVPGSQGKNLVAAARDQKREQVYALVPPERALNADLQPPSDAWANAGFLDPYTGYANIGFGDTGTVDFFNQEQLLPVPTPLHKGIGRVRGVHTATGPEIPVITEIGTTFIYLRSGTPFDPVADVGRLVKISSVNQIAGGKLGDYFPPVVEAETDVDRLLGYWEIIGATAGAGIDGEDEYKIRRIASFNPDTGQPFYHNSNLLHQVPTAAPSDSEIRFNFTLHDSIYNLHRRNYLSPTDLDAIRLDTLIDPSWVQPTLKDRDSRNEQMYGHPAKPDKAIFNTRTNGGGVSGSNANPGSLLDLGFRAVLFPAKIGVAGGIVPDFDNPIEANEVVLDPDVTERQWVDVDYANGTVILSHPPANGTDQCQLCPDTNVLTHPDNPRGEMVFFASFVPFSREKGQRGVGARVTGGVLSGRYGDFCNIAASNHADLYGKRKMWPLADGAVVGSGVGQEIKLDVKLTPVELAPQGFVDLVQGNLAPNGQPLTFENRRTSTWGYSFVIYEDGLNGGNTTLKGVFGGGEAGVGTVTVSLPNEPWSAVLRRNVEMPSDNWGRHGTDYQFDTTYGYSQRSSALRFRHAALEANRDGSVTVDITDPRVDAHEELFKDLFSSWCIRGGEMTTSTAAPNAGLLDFTELTVLIEGVRTILPAQQFQVGLSNGPPADTLVFIDGTDPKCPKYATGTSLPLDPSVGISGNHILIGSYVHDTVNVISYTDLRQPLVDVDKRLDVTVGAPAGHQPPGDAHFNELADAIEFVAETSLRNGWDGQQRRIKVIGPTVEDVNKLPIAPLVSGLIIEGAGRIDPARATPGPDYAITWKGTAPNLFDLAGCSSWIIRDVNFKYDLDGAAPTPGSVDERNLFGVSSGVVYDMTFENVRLIGPASSFFYYKGSGAPLPNGVDRMTFTNCVAHEVRLFGIHIGQHIPSGGNNLDTCNEVVVDRCHFIADRDYLSFAELSSPPVGVVHFSPDAPGQQLSTIRDCYLEGGASGVYVADGSSAVVENCHIVDSDNAGIILGSGTDFVTVRHCYLQTVHQLAGGFGIGAPAKTGIYVDASSSENRIEHNYITVQAAAPGTDFSILQVASANNNVIDNNVLFLGVQGGFNHSILNNSLFSGGINVGEGCLISGNRLEDPTTGELTHGTNCRVEGNLIGQLDAVLGANSSYSNNWFYGDGPHLPGNETHFTNCIFGDPSDPVPEGIVNLTLEQLFTNCWFGNGFTTISPASDVRINNCWVKSHDPMELEGDRLKWSDCSFDGVTTDREFIVDGIGTSFADCHFDAAGWTIQLEDTGAAERSEWQVVNNVVEGQAGGTTRGGFWITGNYSNISGNIIEGFESLSGTPNTYGLFVVGQHNVVADNNLRQAMRVEGNTNQVTGNEVRGVLENGGGVDDNCVYANNRVGVVGQLTVFLNLGGGRHVISDNHVGGSANLVLANNGSTITGNTITHECQLGGRDHTFQGNKVGDKTTLTSTLDVTFSDNQIGSDVEFAGAGTQQIYMSGNRIDGTLGFSAIGLDKLEASTITGNRIDIINLPGTVATVGCTDVTFTGNVVQGSTIVEFSDGCVFNGNRLAGLLDVTNSSVLTVTGNTLKAIFGGAGLVNLDATGNDNYVIVGNRVTGDILLDAGGAGTVNTGIVMGNRARKVGAAAAANPTNGLIAVGNKVDPAQQVFNGNSGAGVPPGTFVEHNNTD